MKPEQVKELVTKWRGDAEITISPSHANFDFYDGKRTAFIDCANELEQAERKAVGQGGAPEGTCKTHKVVHAQNKFCEGFKPIEDGQAKCPTCGRLQTCQVCLPAPRPEASTREIPLEKWWHEIHAHLERPSTSSGIPIDPPLLNGCTREIWDALEYMDYKTFLRAKELTEAVVEEAALAAQPERLHRIVGPFEDDHLPTPDLSNAKPLRINKKASGAAQPEQEKQK